MTDGLWKRFPEELPVEYVLVFFVDPEAGVCVGYLEDFGFGNWVWKDFDGNRIWSKVVYWMPIEYPEAPEGSVDTDWD